MEKNCADKYLKILELSKTDAKYMEYYHSYQKLTDAMQELFEPTPFEDFVLIADYFGLREAMEMRLLEIACEQMDFPKLRKAARKGGFIYLNRTAEKTR